MHMHGYMHAYLINIQFIQCSVRRLETSQGQMYARDVSETSQRRLKTKCMHETSQRRLRDVSRPNVCIERLETSHAYIFLGSKCFRFFLQ